VKEKGMLKYGSISGPLDSP